MLATKKFRDILMSYEERNKALLQFAQIFAGPHDIKVEVVRLHDAYGPTITTPDIEVLVVSEETLPGAEQSTHFFVLFALVVLVNHIRREKEMSQLLIVPVEYVKLSSGERISSSLIRSQHSSPH